MRQFLDRLEQFAVDVILERRGGKRAGLLRIVLRALSLLYLAIVSLRIKLYGSNILRSHQIGCPVVSIGNLTVGGTGKTPVVEKLARELSMRGRRVAILSRGYKSTRRRISGNNPAPVRIVSEGGALLLDSKNAGDEPFMLAKNLRGVAVVVDKDRVECGRHAISQLNSDFLSDAEIRFNEQTGNRLSPIVMTINELKEKNKTNKTLISRILSGKIISGKSPEEFINGR